MALLEDINSGKYNIVLLVIISVFIFHLYWICINKIEPMANLDDTQKTEVKQLIYDTYKIDVAAIKNLSDISTKLQAGGLIVPGNILVQGTTTLVGTTNLQGPLFTDHSIPHPDTKDGAIYRADGQMTIASDDLIRFRSSTNKANTIEMNVNDGHLNLNGKLKESGNDLVPRGVIVAWTGTTAPAGWSLCDGSNNTPDLRGRFILSMGQGASLTNRTINSKDGQEQVTLATNQIPSHNHNLNSDYKVLSPAAYSRNLDNGRYNGVDNSGNALATLSAFNTSITGGGQPHNNMPPFYVLAYIMKL